MSGRGAGQIDGHFALACDVRSLCAIISLQLLAYHQLYMAKTSRVWCASPPDDRDVSFPLNFSGHALHSPWLGTGTLHALNVFATGYELDISVGVLHLGFGTRSSRGVVAS